MENDENTTYGAREMCIRDRFGSAAKYVASTVREIAVDASVYDNKKSVTIVEIMGRRCV